MDITVAICTWNRADSLAATLHSCARLLAPPWLHWELLVIDNNSTDSTPAVVDRFADRLPIRRLFEPAQGLSHARNRAVAEAAGTLVLWTDDDVEVDAGWLAAYADALRRFPDAAFFGGPIEPAFTAPPPPWLRDNLDVLGSALALRDLGAEEKLITTAADLPFGANMAMRRALLPAAPFDPRLGRTGEALLSGEETALFAHLLAAGHYGVWLGNARVRHVIPARRMTVDYVRAYFQGIGRAKPATEGEGKAARVAADPGKWRRRLLWEKVQLMLALRRDGRWARRLVRCAKLEGVLAEIAARP